MDETEKKENLNLFSIFIIIYKKLKLYLLFNNEM